MLNDPEFDKMIIYGLAGVCCVLLLAVIFLAVKKNIYYVDEEGREVPSPRQQAKRAARKRKAKAEPVSEPEPEAVPVETAEPVAEPEVIEEVTPVAEEVTPEPEVALHVPEEVVFPENEPEMTEVPEEEEQVMRFTSDPAEEEVIEPEVVEEESEAEEVPSEIQMITVDDEPEEEDVVEEAAPVMNVPKATGLVVTVTVGGQSETHEIDTLPCLIGREQTSCNLVISEPAVSRRHARIYSNENGLFIEDVSEHNGTYLNGTKLPSLGSAPLEEDDRISLGRAEIAVSRILY